MATNFASKAPFSVTVTKLASGSCATQSQNIDVRILCANSNAADSLAEEINKSAGKTVWAEKVCYSGHTDYTDGYYVVIAYSQTLPT